MRLRVPTPTTRGLLRRVLVPVAAAALIGAGLAAPAAAAPVSRPAAPVVTPSTTEAVAVGAPMTMTVSPGSNTDSVYGYAWTWHPSPGAPVYSGLPACGSDDRTFSVRFVCGSTVDLRVSPPDPVARFTAWAFDASGNRSEETTVVVPTVYDVEALHRVTHQWTTAQAGVARPPPTADPAG